MQFKKLFLKVALSFSVMSIASGVLCAQSLSPEEQSTKQLADLVMESAHAQRETLVKSILQVQNDVGGKLDLDNQDLLLARRLKAIERIVPLDYNSEVRSHINRFVSKNYRPYIGKLLGMSAYYFPIYQEVFEQFNIPQEIRFISVIESSLDPHLVSRSGAVGPWQFMYATAKYHNLTIDNKLDERKDPFLASVAVAEYLKGAYDEFDDWLIALASYNCGRGCVRRAIKRSGMSNPNFWKLSPYLPKETQRYIPKFIAMAYALNYYNEHQVQPIYSELNQEHEVLMVDRPIRLESLAEAVGKPVETLRLFNPSLKTSLIPASTGSPRRVVLPMDEDSRNDSLLYAVLNHENIRKEEALEGSEVVLANTGGSNSAKNEQAKVRYVTYTIKRGDTLSTIAKKYKGVSVQQLKADNNLKDHRIRAGRKLRIAMKN